jgi:hypothetical protein
MTRKIHLTRSLVIVRLKRRLEKESFPRIQMAFIVGLTGGGGLLCSFILLHSGVGSMAVRYPLALIGAYLCFLFLLWLWLRTRALDYLDLPDATNIAQGVDFDSVPSPGITGGGGSFSGGGASASFETPDVAASSDTGILSDVGDAVGSSLDADELAIPLVAIVFAIGLALASLYVIYIAPALLAEVLFDGALSYTLYRRLRKTDSRHWLSTAIRRTLLPFGLTVVFLAVVGAVMAAYAPGARSIGEVIHYAGDESAKKTDR